MVPLLGLAEVFCVYATGPCAEQRVEQKKDLTQDERNTLTSIITHSGRTLAQYNVQELRDLFLEMFCTTCTAVDNPMAQRSSFLVMDEGEIDGTTSYWAEDEDDGGFLHDDTEYTWYQRRFQGRKTRREEKAEVAEDFSDQDSQERKRR